MFVTYGMIIGNVPRNGIKSTKIVWDIHKWYGILQTRSRDWGLCSQRTLDCCLLGPLVKAALTTGIVLISRIASSCAISNYIYLNILLGKILFIWMSMSCLAKTVPWCYTLSSYERWVFYATIQIQSAGTNCHDRPSKKYLEWAAQVGTVVANIVTVIRILHCTNLPKQ